MSDLLRECDWGYPYKEDYDEECTEAGPGYNLELVGFRDYPPRALFNFEGGGTTLGSCFVAVRVRYCSTRRLGR